MMSNFAEITKIVTNVVKEQLAPAKVLEVTVQEDTDFSGDRILRVAVLFESQNNKLDPAKVVGLARHLREPLEKVHEDRFPVFSFMKPGELDGAAA